MKYWLFDGREAKGPFERDELEAQPGFTSEALICPDGSQSSDQWKPARLYLIKPPTTWERLPARAEPEPPPPAKPVELSAVPAHAPGTIVITLPQLSKGQLAALVSALLVPTAYFAMKSRPKTAEKPLEPPPPAAAPAADPQADHAVLFAKGFPLQSAAPSLPEDPADVFSPKRWRQPTTLDELYQMRGLEALAESAARMLKLQGHTAKEGEAEIRKAGERWGRHASRFLQDSYKVSWSAEALPGGNYRVQVEVIRPGSEERRLFEANLGKRTLRPLDVNAWYDLDPKATARWGERNIFLGEDPDAPAVRPAAPEYFGPAIAATNEGSARKNTTASKKATASPPPSAEEDELEYDDLDARPKKKVIAKPARVPKPAEDEEEYDELDAPKPVAAAPPPERAAPAPIAAKPAAPPRNAPAAGPKSAPAAEPPPGPEPSSGPPKPADSGEKKKSVAEMSVDELEKYLKREK